MASRVRALVSFASVRRGFPQARRGKTPDRVARRRFNNRCGTSVFHVAGAASAMPSSGHEKAPDACRHRELAFPEVTFRGDIFERVGASRPFFLPGAERAPHAFQ
jgi:hypothetical protein